MGKEDLNRCFTKKGYSNGKCLRAQKALDIVHPGNAHLLIHFIFGCIRASLLHVGILSLQSGATLSRECVGFPLQCFLLLRSPCSRPLGLSNVSTQTPRLQSTGPIFVAHRATALVACGIFLEQGSNPCLPTLVDFLLLSLQEAPGNANLHDNKTSTVQSPEWLKLRRL